MNGGRCTTRGAPPIYLGGGGEFSQAAAPSAAARCQRDSLSAERLRPGSAVATPPPPQAPPHPTRRQLLQLLLHKLVGSTLPRMYGLGVPALIALLLGQVRRRRPIVRGIHVHDDALAADTVTTTGGNVSSA